MQFSCPIRQCRRSKMHKNYSSNAYHSVAVAIFGFQKYCSIFSFCGAWFPEIRHVSDAHLELFFISHWENQNVHHQKVFCGGQKQTKKMKMKDISRKLKMQFTRSTRQFQRSKYRNYHTSNVYHSVAVVLFAFQKDCGGSKDFFRKYLRAQEIWLRTLIFRNLIFMSS